MASKETNGLKEKILMALDSGQEDDITDIFKLSPSFVSKSIHSLPHDKQDHVWSKISILMKSHMPVSEEASQEDFQKACCFVSSVLSLVKFSLEMRKCYASPSLKKMVLMLSSHLNNCSLNIRSKVAELCERCLALDWAEKYMLSFNLVVYLIQKTLEPQKKKKDLKRVWNLRHFISSILHKENDENTNMLCNLLEKCFLSSFYTLTKVGQMFLSFVFGCKIDLVERFYNNIKWCFPQCSKEKAVAYGKIIFRTWFKADENTQKKIEEFCIQELIYYGIHMDRCVIPIRIMLKQFHIQKKEPSVSTMLINLYDPIIWRSLQVANGYVRANASILFFDAYPLESPKKTVEENDEGLQNQFQQMMALLEDDYPVVRSIASTGICSFLSAYWEMVPNQTLNELLNALIDGPMSDASSADVRISAVKGLAVLLENPLTHLTFKSLLPKIRMMVHDVSEKVRILFCNMLLKIKTIPSIQYWDIVPMDHLLARLELDSAPVTRRIVELICNSYFPKTKSNHSRLERCIVLIESNRPASRVFFKHIHRCQPLEEIGNFLVYTCLVLNKHFEVKSTKLDTFSQSDNKENEEVNTSSSSLTAESKTPLDNINIVGGLIDAVAIFLSTSGYTLNKPTLKEKLKKLLGVVAESVPTFFRHLKGTEVWDSVVYLLSFLAPIDVPILASHCISYLKNLENDAHPSKFTNILISLCIHGKATDVLELAEEWLELGLKSRCDETVAKKCKQQKHVKFHYICDPKPLLAVRFLEALVSKALCLKLILSQHIRPLYRVWIHLKHLKEITEQLLSSSSSIDTSHYEFINEAFSQYCTIAVLLHKREQLPEFSALSTIQEISIWGSQFLLAYINSQNKLHESRKMSIVGEKRRQDEECERKIDLACSLIQAIVKVSIDVIAIGLLEDEFCSIITSFTERLLQTSYFERFIPLVMKLIFQISRFSLLLIARQQEDYVGVTVIRLLDAVISKAFTNTERLEMQTNLSRHCTLAISALKEVLSARFQVTSGIDAVTQEISYHLVEFIIKDIIEHLKKQQAITICTTVDELPLRSAELMKMLGASANYLRLFLQQFSLHIQNGHLSSMFDHFAALHLLNTIMLDSDSCKIQKCNLKEPVLAVEKFCCRISAAFSEQWSTQSISEDDLLNKLYRQVATFLMENEQQE